MNKQRFVDFWGVYPALYSQFLCLDLTVKPSGLHRSGFFFFYSASFYFIIYSHSFYSQGEEDKMVAGADENKSHPSLFIRHEKDTQ